MSEQPDRPKSLKRAPRPAADEGRDPVDAQPAPESRAPQRAKTQEPRPVRAVQTTPSPRPRAGRPRREVTVPFSTRLSPEVLDLIDNAVGDEYDTIRAVVEEAIRSRWGR